MRYPHSRKKSLMKIHFQFELNENNMNVHMLLSWLKCRHNRNISSSISLSVKFLEYTKIRYILSENEWCLVEISIHVVFLIRRSWINAKMKHAIVSNVSANKCFHKSHGLPWSIPWRSSTWFPVIGHTLLLNPKQNLRPWNSLIRSTLEP